MFANYAEQFDKTMSTHKITPFLWFDGKVEEAVKFYTSIFKNSTVLTVSGPSGNVMSATFELEGQRFHAFNGGPMFKFNESISFFVECKTQEEIDYYWEKLSSQGGSTAICGWLKDPFGLSWQIVPSILGELLGDTDTAKGKKAMDAMLEMSKLDIQQLKDAANS